ncbi:PD40 domain-containing protein, partial [candidate division WOR-3 bacterium]|nr:PD40 domain-containing protein [candidate division WOR-3 bacterium]
MKFKIPILMIAFLAVNCSKKSPIEPENEYGYFLYVGNWAGNEVYVIDTDNYVVVDTIGGFEDYISSLAITQDGRKLYVSTRNGPANSPGKVYSVNTITKETFLALNEYGDVYVAPTGIIFVIVAGKMGILDPLSDIVNFIDTLDIIDRGYANNHYNVAFDKSSSLMYGITSNNKLFVYDLKEIEVIRTINMSSVPLHIVLSPDGKTLYFTGAPNVFVVFDVEEDSVVAVFSMNQLGSVAISPDGRYVYITDPGSYLIPEPIPSGKIYVFDTSTNTLIEDIDISEALGECIITDEIIMTPDGRFTYIANWLDKVIAVDLDRKVVEKVIQFGLTETQIVPLALGLKISAV